MTMKKLSCEEQGFTLIEVLTAIAVVSITVVVLMWVQHAAWQGTGVANQQRQASILLEKQVDKIKESMVKNHVMPASGTNWVSGLSKRGVSVEYRVSAAVDSVRKIDLRAVWMASGRPDTFDVQTYVARDY